MKIQILVDDIVINTQLISVEALGEMPPMSELKKMALKQALEDRAITLSQSLLAKFKLFDVAGNPIFDDPTAGLTRRHT